MSFVFFVLAMTCLFVALLLGVLPRVPATLLAWAGMFLTRLYGAPINRTMLLTTLIVSVVVYLITLIVPKWFPSPELSDSFDAVRRREPQSRKAYIINIILNEACVVGIIILTVINMSD